MRAAHPGRTLLGVGMISCAHQGTSYTVEISEGGLALEVLSSGSPLGGSGSESYLGVTGEAFVVLLAKLGISEPELPGYLSSLRGAEWQEFWSLVVEFATSRFSWFDTDWST